MRFFVRIRGARTPPPNIDAPVRNIPLRFVRINYVSHQQHSARFWITDHPAPRTLKPKQRPIPRDAQAYGLVSSKNAPTLNRSPLPVGVQVEVAR
jgi:hypothetical protein